MCHTEGCPRCNGLCYAERRDDLYVECDNCHAIYHPVTGTLHPSEANNNSVSQATI
ncbi:hypothetical protein H6761_00300 [Candidatus Nomurabacteria bacterium]|nr:hypothetical protein [Candidatus Nomurabacteria bacterium]